MNQRHKAHSPLPSSMQQPEPSPFKLYEMSVQSPQWLFATLPTLHKKYLKSAPKIVREDFCGSALISCEWVKKSTKHQALGLDIDPKALAYARSINHAQLAPAQKRRVRLLNQNVLKPTRQKVDLIGAFNYSIFEFHSRKTLLQYARSAYRSLNKKGTLFLEIAGGSGFTEVHAEEKSFTVPGYGTCQMFWEQHQFDPITSINDYSIHFKLTRTTRSKQKASTIKTDLQSTTLNDAFRYHWRIWSIREIREVLEEAGFQKTTLLWPTSQNSNQFKETEHSTQPMHSFTAFVVGVKK